MQESFGVSPHGWMSSPAGRVSNVESLAASAANSRVWSVSLPEGSMNQINHGAKEAENLQYK